MGAAASTLLLKDALATLKEHDVADAAFWDPIWKLQTTPSEIYEILSADDIRRLRKDRPGNVAGLFAQAVAKLCAVVENPSPSEFEEALTAVRLLTRVMPFLIESYRDPDSGGTDPFLENLFWGSRPPAAGSNATGQQQPLGAVLVKAVMLLLFLPGFTVAAASDSNAPFPGDSGYDPLQVHQSALCWEHKGLSAAGGGAAAAAAVGGGHHLLPLQGYHLERNRMEVMRLLLTLMSEPLYVRSEDPNVFLGAFAQEVASADTPHAAELFVSLMNVVLSYDPVGWGVPYASSVVSDVPIRQMTLCAQLLVVLLDCTKPVFASPLPSESAPAPTSNGNGERKLGGGGGFQAEDDDGAELAGFMPRPPPLSPGEPGYNVFVAMLQALDSAADLSFVYEGLMRLLNNVHEARSTYLPGTMAHVGCYQELLVLLWKLMAENPAFTVHMLAMCDARQEAHRLAVPVVFLMLEYRRDPGKVALEHICTYILLKLSGERAFGVALNQPYAQRLPVDLPLFTGNYADLLIVALHKLVVSGSDRLSGLYTCFLTIICNISPYCRSLSLVASVKLLNLFELFTSPRVLYAAEANHVYVSLLLEIFNNLVQYQYSGNQHLVYAIVRRKEAFDRLNSLDLSHAIQGAHDHASLASRTSAAAAIVSSDATAAAGAAARGAEEQESYGGKGRISGSGAGHAASLESKQEGAGGVTSGKRASASAGGTSTPQRAAAAAPRNSEGRRASRSLTPGRAASGDRPAVGAAGAGGGVGGDWTAADGVGADDGGGRRQPVPRFMPTMEWLVEVKAQMRLNTIMGLLRYLVPQVDAMCERVSAADEAVVIEFLRNTTCVGLLPVPHPIISRKFSPNYFTALWFTSFMWAVVFQHNQELPIFDGAKVKLFTVTFA